MVTALNDGAIEVLLLILHKATVDDQAGRPLTVEASCKARLLACEVEAYAKDRLLQVLREPMWCIMRPLRLPPHDRTGRCAYLQREGLEVDEV